ncbi:MAG TPA: serine hydrolase domain-containing protein [Polyangiaceae bacterium]|jgi:CubicO group peptidase (beta-lactamase class C family)
MSNSCLDEIARSLVVEPLAAPAASVAVAIVDGAGWRVESGAAGRVGERSASRDTLFDLASVTKPFLAATTARLVRQGRLSFETPLESLLVEARGTPSGSATVELLLSHRAGLDAHRALFAPLLAEAPLERQVAIREATRAVRPRMGAGSSIEQPPLYSDLGYFLLGVALERLTHRPLDELIAEQVCAPLALEVGSARQLRRRIPDFAQRVAPTEVVPFRGGQVHGVVHDENAWALAGHGAAGHAGLFGAVESIARFGAALLDALHERSDEWLDRASVSELVRPRGGGTLRAGFDGKSSEGSSAGARASAQSFGHLGFTGTSLWCDPELCRATALLSNRVCPTRNNAQIRLARPAVHDALFGLP